MKRTNIGILLMIVLLFSACGRNAEQASRNMEQIYEESGIPVKVLEVQPTEFVLELPFTAKITGLQQANASAMIGGMIEKVLVKVGDYVSKDQVLVEFPEDVPAGQLTQARSAYELTKSTYQRMKNLFELGGISRQELDGVETQYKVAAANYDAALQMLKVRAPINGHVTSVTVRETDSVQSETVLVTIAQTDMMKAKVWVTENEICQITTGEEATFTWNDQVLTGGVTSVALAMDLTHNAFAVDLIFDNSQNICKSGVIGDINITVYKNETAYVIPRKNVMNDVNGRYVYLMNNDLAHKQYITTGQENGNFEVLTGLKPGDEVIVEGLNLVTDGVKVRVVE
jgi:RND family efflux transporter MFP subunit